MIVNYVEMMCDMLVVVDMFELWIIYEVLGFVVV